MRNTHYSLLIFHTLPLARGFSTHASSIFFSLLTLVWNILETLAVDNDEQLDTALHTNFLVPWPTLNRSHQKKVLIANGKGSIADLKKKTSGNILLNLKN